MRIRKKLGESQTGENQIMFVAGTILRHFLTRSFTKMNYWRIRRRVVASSPPDNKSSLCVRDNQAKLNCRQRVSTGKKESPSCLAIWHNFSHSVLVNTLARAISHTEKVYLKELLRIRLLSMSQNSRMYRYPFIEISLAVTRHARMMHAE